MAAQSPLNFTVQPAPVNTTSTSAFTLASFDLANMPGIGGNYTDCTVFVRATVLMFEVGGGTYSTAWEICAVFRRDTTGNAVLQVAVVNGNNGTGGQVGQADTSTITMDASTTNVRLRVTPGAAGSRWWYGKLQVTAIEPA